jgi:hypothetical protein
MRHWSIRRAMSVVETVMGRTIAVHLRLQDEGKRNRRTLMPCLILNIDRPARPALQPDFLAHEVKSRDSRMLDRHAWTRAVLPTGVPNQQMIPTQVEEVPGHERLSPSGHACSCRAASC